MMTKLVHQEKMNFSIAFGISRIFSVVPAVVIQFKIKQYQDDDDDDNSTSRSFLPSFHSAFSFQTLLLLLCSSSKYSSFFHIGTVFFKLSINQEVASIASRR
jgi:hypothetical protein